jgi:hypothetical protein
LVGWSERGDFVVTTIPAVCLTCRAPLDLTLEYTRTSIAKWMVCKCPVCQESTPIHAAGSIVQVIEHGVLKRTVS